MGNAQRTVRSQYINDSYNRNPRTFGVLKSSSTNLERAFYEDELNEALWTACEHNHPSRIRLLLDTNVNVNARDETGCSAVHYAAEAITSEPLQLLHSTGLININDNKNNDERTPLMGACERGRVDAAAFLVENGADALMMDSNGLTAFHIAACSVFVSLTKRTEILDECLKWDNVNVDIRDGNGRTALMLTHSANVARKLIECGADVNAVDNDGLNVLHYVFHEHGHGMIMTAIAKSPDLNITGATIDEQLFLAVCTSNLRRIKHLIRKGANLSSRDTIGFTLIHYAVQAGDLEMIKFFVTEHPDLDLDDMKNIKEITPLMAACRFNKLDVAKYLYQASVSAGSQRKHRSLIWGALCSASMELFDFAIEVTDIGVNSTGHRNVTPLTIAAIDNNYEIVRKLISLGAYVNAKDVDNRTALYYASIYGYEETVKILLECPNIDAAICDRETGRPPFAVAGSVAVRSLLFDHVKKNPNMYMQYGNFKLSAEVDRFYKFVDYTETELSTPYDPSSVDSVHDKLRQVKKIYNKATFSIDIIVKRIAKFELEYQTIRRNRGSLYNYVPGHAVTEIVSNVCERLIQEKCDTIVQLEEELYGVANDYEWCRE